MVVLRSSSLTSHKFMPWDSFLFDRMRLLDFGTASSLVVSHCWTLGQLPLRSSSVVSEHWTLRQLNLWPYQVAEPWDSFQFEHIRMLNLETAFLLAVSDCWTLGQLPLWTYQNTEPWDSFPFGSIWLLNFETASCLAISDCRTLGQLSLWPYHFAEL
jgi:hypothetical protein